MPTKRITVSEPRKQKLYEAVTEIVMKYRIQAAQKFPNEMGKEFDSMLFKIQMEVGKAATESIEQALK